MLNNSYLLQKLLLSTLLSLLLPITNQQQQNILKAFTETSTQQDYLDQGWQGFIEELHDQCTGTILVLDNRDSAQITINNLPQHDTLAINATIMCSQRFQTNAYDMNILVDGQLQEQIFGQNFNVQDFRNCSYGDNHIFNHTYDQQFVNISIPHSQDNYELKFEMTNTQSIVCLIADLCVQPTNDTVIDDCMDNLMDLTKNGTIQMNNSCRAYTYNILEDEQIVDIKKGFEFKVWFISPYIFDQNCLDLQVKFGNETLEFGSLEFFDNWNFNATNQTIIWDIKLDDFVDVYNCSLTETNSQYTWFCPFQVDIYYQQTLQMIYKAKIKVILNRNAEADDDLQIDILQNIIDGQCCNNTLNINTELNICTNENCTSYHDPSQNIQIQRGQTFYAEHKISDSSATWQNYYLQHTQVKMGPSTPIILAYDSSTPGRVILKLRQSIAMQNVVLQVNSLLHKSPFSPLQGRRFLQQQEQQQYDLQALRRIENGEYQLSAVTELSIYSPQSSSQDNDSQFLEEQQQVIVKKTLKKSESNQNTYLMLSILICSSFILATSIALFVRHFKQKQQLQLQKKSTQQQEEETDEAQTQTRQRIPSSASSNGYETEVYEQENQQK